MLCGYNLSFFPLHALKPQGGSGSSCAATGQILLSVFVKVTRIGNMKTAFLNMLLYFVTMTDWY